MLDLFKKYSWILIVVFLTILIVAGIIRKPSPLEVPVLGRWETPPSVVLCPGSPFTLEDVKAAVNKYQQIGHEFEEVIEVPYCSKENIPGWIKIAPPGPRIKINDVGHAHTRYIEETGEIISSYIEIRDSINKLVIEHEIGHALGYAHVRREGHIMYPNVRGLGDNYEGMFRIQTDI